MAGKLWLWHCSAPNAKLEVPRQEGQEQREGNTSRYLCQSVHCHSACAQQITPNWHDVTVIDLPDMEVGRQHVLTTHLYWVD